MIQCKPSHLNAAWRAVLQGENLQVFLGWSWVAPTDPAFIVSPERGGLCLCCVDFLYNQM